MSHICQLLSRLRVVDSSDVIHDSLSGISDFDGENAVVASYAEGGTGAVWALSKKNGSWDDTPFQSDAGDRFAWDAAVRCGYNTAM